MGWEFPSRQRINTMQGWEIKGSDSGLAYEAGSSDESVLLPKRTPSRNV